MAAGDIFQMTAVYLVSGEPCANVFYQEVIDEPGSQDSMADAAEALDAQLLSAIAQLQVTTTVYECILGRRVFPTTSPARVFLINRVGLYNGAGLPANVALTIRHYSEDGDKRKRGRYYLAGLGETAVNTGAWETPLATIVDDVIEVLIAQFSQSGRDYRIKHFSPFLGTYFDVDSCTWNPIPTKVRGRTPGICSIS